MIRDPEVRVIGPDGEQLGVMSSKEAYFKAQDLELDLVKISPNANPPVCKITDYNNFLYEQKRKEKLQRKNQKQVELKELRMSPNIDTNDLNIKINAARKFLEKGNKVKVTIRFYGRELGRMKTSQPMLDSFAEKLSDISSIDKQPLIEGRNMSMILTPKTGQAKKKPQQEQPKEQADAQGSNDSEN